MHWTPKTLLSAATVVAAIGIGGCAVHDEPPQAEPVTVGYPIDDAYYGPQYEQGWYVGNDWHWRDRDGHERYESRDSHERRMSEGRTHLQQQGGRQEYRNDNHETRAEPSFRQDQPRATGNQHGDYQDRARSPEQSGRSAAPQHVEPQQQHGEVRGSAGGAHVQGEAHGSVAEPGVHGGEEHR